MNGLHRFIRTKRANISSGKLDNYCSILPHIYALQK